jgi:hypothetical protein
VVPDSDLLDGLVLVAVLAIRAAVGALSGLIPLVPARLLGQTNEGRAAFRVTVVAGLVGGVELALAFALVSSTGLFGRWWRQRPGSIPSG